MINLSPLFKWSGRLDSNQRPLEPHSSALSQAALRPVLDFIYGFCSAQIERLFIRKCMGCFRGTTFVVKPVWETDPTVLAYLIE